MARYGDPYAKLWSDEDLVRMRDDALMQWSENRAPKHFHDNLMWEYVKVLERALIDSTTTIFTGREKLPKFARAVNRNSLPKGSIRATE